MAIRDDEDVQPHIWQTRAGTHQRVSSRRLIQADRPRPLFDGAELWRYREVVFYLVWRSFKARYRQTYFGMLWAIVQPLAAMAVYSVVFGRLVGVPSEGLPYPLFVLCALIPWNFFTRSVGAMTGSVVGNQDLIKRVYFPRLGIPLAELLAALGNMVFGWIILIGVLIVYGVAPPVQVLLVPFFLLLTMAVALGIGLMTCSINVRFRDIGYAVPFTLQLMLFLTPVIYPITLLPEEWRTLYAINPMVGIIGGFRWSILGVTPDWTTFAISTVSAALILGAGLWMFARNEDFFADHV